MSGIRPISIDPGAPGGDQTVLAFFVSEGRTYINQGFIARGRARQTGKSELQRWLQIWNRGGYWKRVAVEKAAYGKRLPARPKPSKLRHYEKLNRYQMRALNGRTAP